jgi:hypothetical protein
LTQYGPFLFSGYIVLVVLKANPDHLKIGTAALNDLNKEKVNDWWIGTRNKPIEG